ncbi:hypothetical protein [Leptolyngbya ohadii]|uniref:hypothetical protein n=1 Tax=Leptolyngbya ohadii TaxID=1962290 RepID=UPI000B5991D4|nr:hypothetical protein [Leptolyngbya ohadii]
MIHSSERKWFIRAIAGVLIPSYIFAVCTRVYAANNSGAAEIYRVNNPNTTNQWGRLQFGRYNSVNSNSPHGGERLVNWNQFLWVPGRTQAWARLEHITANGGRSRMAVQAGPSNVDSSYQFPCEANGNIVIGWHPGQRGRMCSGTAGFTLRLPASGNRAEIDNPGRQYASKELTLAETVVANTLYQYCSTASKNRGWWASWGTNDDPCTRAIELCLQSASADRCEIVGTGSWYARDPDVLAIAGCPDNRVYTQRNSGREIATRLIQQIDAETKADGQTVCALNVYRPGDVNVSPASEDATLVSVETLNSSMTIKALTGDIVVRNLERPEGFVLETGNQYIYPQNQIQPLNPAQAAQSPVVQEFLNPANWSPDTLPDLQAYQSGLSGEPQTTATQPDDRPRRPNFIERILPIAVLLGVVGLADIFSDEPDRTPGQGRESSQGTQEPSYQQQEDSLQDETPTDGTETDPASGLI